MNKIRLSFVLLLVFVLSGESLALDLHKITIIYTEEIEYGDLGCYYDNSADLAPDFDQMTHERILFADSYSPSIVGSPLRCAPQSDQRIYGSTGKSGETFSGSGCHDYLKTGTLTIAEMFKTGG
jgi:hypothetical protein